MFLTLLTNLLVYNLLNVFSLTLCKNGTGNNGTGNNGTGNNGTGNNGTNGKVIGKSGTLMLNFPKPQIQTPHPNLKTQTSNIHLESVLLLPTFSFLPFLL